MRPIELVLKRIVDLEFQREKVIEDRKRAAMMGKSCVVSMCDASLRSIEDMLLFNKNLEKKLQGEKS
jgi:hypothetical protein